jgi:hypothetical protein
VSLLQDGRQQRLRGGDHFREFPVCDSDLRNISKEKSWNVYVVIETDITILHASCLHPRRCVARAQP